ncbi:tetratricopeptide repeat protein [Bdellovibrio svalbardensis]|uniref:Tetratricopeptide repeat protein n=1 Tax=Bdellovibrio svalbardensis TaxID=2972972 RepID=A0ABT6DET7_9BACT|nr:tetratricopeptide repeat protein [Bdellovibrio svalbardensis]MDG0815351.1 tetratricopeptide repeat protein [Bdellovibrio svalbardensis]
MNALRNVLVAGCLIFSLVPALAASVNGAISFQGDTVHLELSGQQNWDYDVKRSESKGKTVVEMTVPALDDSTVQALNNFKSEMVTQVSVDRKGPDGKYLVYFTLSGASIDTFDYLTDQPSRLIVDFYVNPSAKADKKSVAKKEPTTKADSAKSSKALAKNKTDKTRTPATADALAIADQGAAVALNDSAAQRGIFDGGDPNYERFTIKPYDIKEESVIRAKDNYYIPFPMLETPVSYWEKLKNTPTIYEISPKPTDENKQARLLLTLFEKQRYAVYLKTVQWFKEKYPTSQYNEVIDFMTADVHLALSQGAEHAKSYEDAIQKYKEAIAKYPQSPLAERTSLKIGYLALERGDNLAALRLFNEHIANKNFGGKESLSKDLARMGSGLAYMRLNRWEDAVAQYEDIEKNSIHRDLKVEAAYRRGDVWIKAKNYAKATSEYQNALKKYPEGQTFFPNAYYNQAESLFGMQKYPQSLDLYREFVKKFPSSEHAPFAMTRMGELLEILGADKSRVMGAYLETYFRYGENPSAVISRLRLLSTRMKGMKPKETDNAVKEIMSLAKKVDLPNIEQFATVMVADGYTQRGEFDKSISLLSKYYKEHPTSVDIPLMTQRIVTNINNKLEDQVNDGNFIGALKTHNQYSDSWLKNSKRLDTKFNVGRAFEMAGVPIESEKYYKDVLNRVYAIRGTPEAKEISVKERVPTEDELNLRLAAVSTNEQKYNQAYEYLKNVKTPEKLSELEQIERVNIAVRLLERRGDNESAIRYLGELLRTWKGQPELVAEPYLKLAELQIKQGKKDEALQALGMIDKLSKDSDHVSPVVHAKALESMGDIYLAKNSKDQAIDAYQTLLEKYEQTRPLSSIRYKLGQIYFKRGDMQLAAETWNEFKGEKSGFWKNLAQEQLKNSEWRDGYKKYIKRIPAMSEKESK